MAEEREERGTSKLGAGAEMDQVPEDGLSHHKKVHEGAICWRFVRARRGRRMGCLGGISRVGELNLGSLEPVCLVPKPAGWLVRGSVIF